MKLVSKAALGAALALGSLSMTVALPAHAAKEKKGKDAAPAAQDGPKLNLSKEFQQKMAPAGKVYNEAAQMRAKFPNEQAAAADPALKAKWTEVRAALDALAPQATTADETYQVNELRLSAGVGLGDSSLQAAALEGMLATGLVPQSKQGLFHYYSGKFAYERKEYPKAETEFNEAARIGYLNQDLFLNQARLYNDTKRPVEANTAMEKATEEQRKTGVKVPEPYYLFGYQQAYNGKLMPAFVKWTTGQLRDYPTADNWRTNLQNYFELTKNLSPGRKGLGGKIDLDIYRLMRASKALAGENDTFDYAYLANSAGLPLEAKTVLTAWKAGGGKLNPEMADLDGKVSARAAQDSALLAKINPQSADPVDGDLVLAAGDYAKAATIYQAAVAKGGLKDVDETQMHLGIALSLSGQKEPAKAAFQAVKGARADLAQYWITFLDVPPQPANTATTGQ